LFFLLCLTGAAFSATVWGDDLIVSRGVLEDRAGMLSIADVVHADFKPYGPILAKGFSDSAFWLRIRVKPRDDGDEVVLRILPIFLDEVTLYESDPTSPGGWKIQIAGDHTVSRGKVALNFIVRPAAPESVYYLRLKTISTSTMFLKAFEPEQARNRDYSFIFFQTLFMGFMFLLLFWGISTYVSTRQKLLAWYVLYQSFIILLWVASTGRLELILPSLSPESMDKLHSILVCLSLLTTLLFHRAVFALFAPHRLAMRALDAMIALILATLMLLIAGQGALAMHINGVLTLLMCPLLLVLAFSARQDAAPGRRILRAAYVVLAITLFVFQSVVLGWLEPNNSIAVVFAMHGIISASLMFLLPFARNRQLLRDAQREKDHAEKANADKTRFLASASHDLRQPMQAMSLYIEVLNHRLKQPEDKEVVEALRESHSSMNRLMDSLLDISKLDAGVVEFNLEPICLDVMIANLMRDFALIADKKGITMRARLSGAAVSSDLVMLECILNNLIGNAVRYTETGGQILLACRRRHGKVFVEIWDTGIGIAPDQLENIFTEFYQLGNSERDRNKGLGLGLSIIGRLLKLLPNHAVEVASKPGHGSRFRIIMPEATGVGVNKGKDSFAPQNAQFEGVRILMLEDDLAARRAAVMLVQEWGCEVKDVASAAEAVAEVERGWIPNAIISDYRLVGEATGVQAIHAIRQLLKQDIPALIVTGETQAEIRQEVADANALLLHKPAVPAKLKLFLGLCVKQLKTGSV